MAYNISDTLESAQFFFFNKNSCHGFLHLKGREMSCAVSLTGTCSPDLWGKRLYITPNPDIKTDPPDSRLEKGLHDRQVGVTGEMTAARWVRYYGCAPSEVAMSMDNGNQPPFEWKRGVYLEWFSANGRVVIELIDPIIEVWVSGENKGEGDNNEDWELLPEPDGKPALPDSYTPPETSSINLAVREAFPFGESLERVRRENDLFSGAITPEDDMNSQLNTIAIEMGMDPVFDKTPPYDPDDPSIRELDYIEEIIEGRHDEDDLIATILPERGDLSSLSEEEAEAKVKVILAGLALYNIAIDRCEHCSAHQLLHLIYDNYAIESRLHPGMIGTGWVTHLDNYEGCEQCMAECPYDWEPDPDGADATDPWNNPPF